MNSAKVYLVDGIPVEVTRKRIKNLILKVAPPDGTVKLSVPYGVREETVWDFLTGHAEWIKKKREAMRLRNENTLRDEFAGRGDAPFSAADRKDFRAMVQNALDRWEPAAGKHCTSFTVREMKSRWGSCNPATGKMSFNLKLLRMEPRFLDYVVCHELCHLWVPNHSKAFWACMDRVYPNWRAVRKELNGKGAGR